ncbi:MAG: TlpA family protein disulfide reductase [Bacteroidetes bacterium]|nr:TlpA family protein disulfide reductase [Bacteroidota bacterium]MBU1719393.1 TlpA family protein disulfide reductase [Bacteroidota bacterium]
MTNRHVLVKLMLVTILFFIQNAVAAQSLALELQIAGTPPDQMAHLSLITGDRYKIVDSTVVKDEKIVFLLKKQNPPGVYRIDPEQPAKSKQFNRNTRCIDIIIDNKENISISTIYNAETDSLKIHSSEENKNYRDFLKTENIFQRKLELLHPVVAGYPEGPFLTEAIKQYNSIQKERENYILNLSKKHKGTIFAKLARMYRSPFLEASITENEKYNIMLKEYFSVLDFSDTALINASIYTDKVLRYLMLYRNQSLSPTEQEQEFIRAVDVIMANTAGSRTVQEFVIDFLVRGFESFKMETVLVHISDNYMNQNCENDDKSVLEKRLEAYKKMAIGQTAPDFDALKDVSAEYTLILFWATWCPHCMQVLPGLKQIYDSSPDRNYEIIAVSLDTSATDYKKVLDEYGISWKNLCDLKGWDGKLAEKYNIYASPTMFLIDKSRKIIAKPMTAGEAEKALEDIQ